MLFNFNITIQEAIFRKYFFLFSWKFYFYRTRLKHHSKTRMNSSPTKNKKYSLEYTIKSSPSILYEFLSTPSGLSQWFADRVDSFQNQFTFSWDNSGQKAKVLAQHENDLIRFQWADSNKEEYFEFKIMTTEITGDTVLLITDFANPKEMKDTQRLWDSQVHELKKRLGGL